MSAHQRKEIPLFRRMPFKSLAFDLRGENGFVHRGFTCFAVWNLLGVSHFQHD
jgi:hypothetical protein